MQSPKIIPRPPVLRIPVSTPKFGVPMIYMPHPPAIISSLKDNNDNNQPRLKQKL